MKHILYITVCSLLYTMTHQEADYYDLVLDATAVISSEDVDTELDGMDTYSAFKFHESSPVSIPVENIPLSDTTLSSPFIIHAIFKLEEVASSCLFTIADKYGTVKLGLCLTPAGKDITRITLESDGIPDKQASFTFSENLKNKWTKLLLHVEERKVSFRVNCTKIDASEFREPVEDLYFAKDSNLFLGHSGTGSNNFFKGPIQGIKIYLKGDDRTLKDICTEDTLPDSFETITDETEFKGDFDKYREPPPKGEKGSKGEPGISVAGPRGAQGPQGPPGPTGLPGKEGEEGKCECSESVVSSLLKTMPEMRGPPGEPGPRGDDGVEGSPGMTGKPGEQGIRGPPGLKGETGDRGDDGRPGRDGDLGPKGEAGRDGEPGPPGPQGVIGPPGPPGPGYKETGAAKEIAMPGEKGNQGPIGPPGPPGPKGIKGDKGETGQLGIKGEMGDRGHKGIEGPRGEKGERGESGRDGLPGEPGVHGKNGEKGDKGDLGEKGENGAPGIPAKLSSLLDPDMDLVENAAIVEKLRGFKGEMGLPGEKGNKGDKGPMGPAGVPGKDGHHGPHGERGLQGPQGDLGPAGPRGHKGDRGEPGPPGNVPTEAISLMKGSKGDRGPPGRNGPRGPSGPLGKRGPIGPSGPKGSKGNTGSSGPTGSAGLRGEKGLTGDKGEKGDSAPPIDIKKLKGDKGDRGDDGAPGNTGPPGPPGAPGPSNPNTGYVPVPGPPGPPGPPGSPGISVTGPKGEPGGIVAQKMFYTFTDANSGDPNDEDDFYTSGTVIYKTTTALIKKTSSTPLGTLAYVLREKTLLLRVENGWQYVVMGNLLQTGDIYPSPPPHPLPLHVTSSTAAPIIEAPIERTYIRLAALNEPYSGKMYSFTNRTGRNAANYDCHRQSWRSGFSGTFVAFLANKVEDLKSIVKTIKDRNLPVVNLRGELLFDSWSNMFNGSGAVFAKSTPNIYSFSGRRVLIDPTWPKKVVWHGGDVHGIRSPKAFCDEWQSDSPKYYGIASPLNRNKLLEQEMYPCNSKLIVLCVEVTSATRRRQRHPQSRRRPHYSHLTNEVYKSVP